MAVIVFTTIGSWGDLFPFVGVSRELQRRGHDVTIAASPAWADIVAEAGIDFAPLGRRVGFEEFKQHPEIFGRMPFGLRAALREFVFDQIDDLTADLRTALAGADLVVSHPAQIAALNVAEHLGVRCVVGTVFPSMIRSAHTVPGGTPIGPWRGRLGRAMNRSAWTNARLASAVLFDRPINRHRGQLGLPTVRAGLLRLPMRAAATLVMASPAVIDPPPDWPGNVTVTSFVTWDRGQQHPVPEPTARFLEAGDPPILITRGASGAIVAGDFFEHVTGEVVAAGARALVVTGPARPPSRSFDSTVVHVTDFVPFSAVAHRCRAAVHHAGIGTSVAMMRAGIPQLAVPKGFDQPVTAGLIEKLGIGIAVAWRRRHRRLPQAVGRLLDDDSLSRAAHELAARLEREDGISSTASAIESNLIDRPLDYGAPIVDQPDQRFQLRDGRRSRTK